MDGRISWRWKLKQYLGFLLVIAFAAGCNGKSPSGNGGQNPNPTPTPPTNQYLQKEVKDDKGKIVEKISLRKAASGELVNDGEYLKFYPESGKVAVRGINEAGKMVGRWEYFAEDGKKTKEVDYVADVLNGKVTEFYPSGKIMKQETFKNGKRDGHCRRYYENGIEAESGYLLGDQKEGEWLYFDEKGNTTKKESYIKGELVLKRENVKDIADNEGRVKDKMKELLAGIENFKRAAHVDVDKNEEGEYGFLPELAGLSPCRTPGGLGGPKLSDSPYIEEVFGKVDENGNAEYSGYYFRLYLPGAHKALTAAPDVPAGDKGLAKFHEKAFACYAWPKTYGVTGVKVFFVNQEKQLFASTNEKKRYEGKTGPEAKAIYDREKQSAEADNLLSAIGTNQNNVKPYDAETWYLVQ